MSVLCLVAAASDDGIEALGAKTKQVEVLIDCEDRGDERPRLHLDRSWQGIHWLLTGSEWAGGPPLNFILYGGQALGGRGDGPLARALKSAEVRELADALSNESRDTLRKRYETQNIDLGDHEEEAFQYHIGHFESLKEFVQNAAANNSGMIVYFY